VFFFFVLKKDSTNYYLQATASRLHQQWLPQTARLPQKAPVYTTTARFRPTTTIHTVHYPFSTIHQPLTPSTIYQHQQLPVYTNKRPFAALTPFEKGIFF
jgi:hypothetical protein